MVFSFGHSGFWDARSFLSMNPKYHHIFFAFLLLPFLSVYRALPDQTQNESGKGFIADYSRLVGNLAGELQTLDSLIRTENWSLPSTIQVVRRQTEMARLSMKKVDLFLRYADPIAHKKINGPLPVEWETEVFEKHEKPYKRLGSGLALLTENLESPQPERDSLLALLAPAQEAVRYFQTDSMKHIWEKPEAFFLANRLFILNLASIYTTGFECPDRSRILPELQEMLSGVNNIYPLFNAAFPSHRFPEIYLKKFAELKAFVDKNSHDIEHFDHFVFLQKQVNPLFRIQQQLIQKYRVKSNSMVDYSLNDQASSLFSKYLFYAQDSRGIFNRLQNKEQEYLADSLGKLLFFDPILSGNNERSCVSCHKPDAFFADTSRKTPEGFHHSGPLTRNTPSLLNVLHNHLLMYDGRFYSLQQQVADVILNPQEMAGDKNEILRKILSCSTYKKGFESLLPETYTENEVSFSHVVSALTRYIARFSYYSSPFDEAMENKASILPEVRNGFNLFMGKAGCGTCHFVPQFNGVKPPFTNSEFEVLGTPEKAQSTALSSDKGRSAYFDAPETRNAFRTSTLRNSARTPPYMHNGVFRNMEEVISFYDAGGGTGKGLLLPNQSLSSDSLHLSENEKNALVVFMKSLNEEIKPEKAPVSLPESPLPELKNRKVGGHY